jgi:energy-coupling factor transporter ATP-binding protein EcfA2
MKLRIVEVTDYKSIRRSNPFKIGEITCLVGKNESGKTALLEALYRLNPLIADDGKFDVGEDFPRSDVEDYRQAVAAKKQPIATAIKATFELEKADLEDLYKVYGMDALSERIVTTSKGYDNTLHISIPINEPAIVRHLTKVADLTGEAANSMTLSALANHLAVASTKQAAAHAQAITQANTIGDVTEKAKAVDNAKALSETAKAQQLRASLAELLKQNPEMFFWEK